MSADATPPSRADGPVPPAGFGHVLAVWQPGGTAEAALSAAAGIARAGGGRLSVIAFADGMSEAELERFARSTGRDPGEVKAGIAAAARERVEEAARRLAPDLSPGIEVVFGKPFIEIVRRAIAGGHDLVVKHAEELGGPLRHLLASTDQHLLRKCPAPVLLLRGGDGGGLPGPVAAAVDVSGEAASEPDTEARLNRRIVDVGLALAGVAGVTLHLVSVWEFPAEGLVRMYGDRWEGDLERHASDIERQHARDLNELVATGRERAKAAGLDVAIAPHLVRGTPRSAIPGAVADLGAGLVVMGTVARTGVKGLIIGNTAEDVLNSIATSVVAVKPPGYVSPLAG